MNNLQLYEEAEKQINDIVLVCKQKRMNSNPVFSHGENGFSARHNRRDMDTRKPTITFFYGQKRDSILQQIREEKQDYIEYLNRQF